MGWNNPASHPLCSTLVMSIWCKHSLLHVELPPCNQSDVLGFDGMCRPVDCGGTLYAMAGVVHPPNWPNPSPDTMLCQWAIVLPDPERSIRIVVDEIDIKDVPNCFWNYVMVFDSSAVENAVPPLLGNRM